MSKFALLFLMVFFGGILASLIYSGSYAFALYQLIYFLNPDNRWWSSSIPGLRYSFIVVLLMMGILFKNYQRYSAVSPWNRQPILKWLAALLVMYYVAYTFAINMPMHNRFTFDFTKLVIIMFIAYKLIDTEKAFNISLWGYVVGCFYIGYLATITGRNAGNRLEGIGMIDAPEANGTAAALVPAAVILLYFAWQGNLKVKLMAGLMGAFIANALVLINSRGSFLGVVVSLGCYLMFMMFSRYQKKGQRGTAVFMIVVGLSGAYYMTDDLFWERMSTLKEVEEGSRESGASRTVFWLTTFDMLEDHPLGLGVRGYNTLAPLYMDDETRGGELYRSVHSTWFQGLSEVGFIGFSFFLAMLFTAYRLTRRAKLQMIKEGRYEIYFKILAIECALLGFLVAATFIDRFRAEILYWMILFLALASKFYYLHNPEVKAPAPKRAPTLAKIGE